jgi:hypothetical protein
VPWAGKTIVLTPERASFLDELAAEALHRDWLNVWFPELDGRPAAANLDLRYAAAEVFFMPGMDGTFRMERDW